MKNNLASEKKLSLRKSCQKRRKYARLKAMKKKIFIVGTGPLPSEKEGIREAGGLRTEQFIRPLQRAGHHITLILITSSHTKEHSGTSHGIEWTRVQRHDRQLMSLVKKQVKKSDPDLCIGVNTFPAFVLSKCIPDKCPFWADLNGWIMAEAQARSWSEDNNNIFANAWRQEKAILHTADKISTVSSAQKFCVIGELSSIGMIRKENFLEEKVFAIPNATTVFDIDTPSNSFRIHSPQIDTKRECTPVKNRENHVEHDNDNRTDKVDKEDDNMLCSQKLFKGIKTPQNSFIIAWIGGYNNWVDEQTLFTGIVDAMSKDERIYFVSTGGALKNIAQGTFGRFRQQVDKSPFKKRFIFLGWIENEDIRKIYEEADIGINVDYKCLETETGARNRLNEMMKFGLPILTTGGSEIAEYIGKQCAGITVENGNATALTESILTMSKLSVGKSETAVKNRTLCSLQEYGKVGQYLSTEVFTDEQTIRPLLQYAESPTKTVLPPLPIDSLYMYIKNIWWYIKKNNWKTVLGKIWQRMFP